MQIALVLHNLLRWAVLIFGVWSVFNAIKGLISKQPFTKSDDRTNLLFMIFCDVQLLIGLLLYFGNDWFARLRAGGDVLKNASTRFYALEHLTLMLFAWVLVHVARVIVKKGSMESKHKKALIFFGLTLFIILASIPWPFRTGIGRPLFRGFN